MNLNQPECWHFSTFSNGLKKKKNISAGLPQPSAFGSLSFLEKVLQIYPPLPLIPPPPSPLFLPLSSPIIPFIVMVMESAVRDHNVTNLIDEKEITERSQRRGGLGGLHTSAVNDIPSPKPYGINYGTLMWKCPAVIRHVRNGLNRGGKKKKKNDQ